MILAQLRNELWKLFGKKRTYIGFGAFVVVQTLMLLLLKFTPMQHFMERMLSGAGYVVSDYISALTVSVEMLKPQNFLLMPLYIALVGGDIVAKEAEDGTLRMILSRPISRMRLLLVKGSTGIIFATLLVLTLGVIALGFARVLFPWKGMFVFAPGVFGVFQAGEGLERYALSQLFLVANASVVLCLAFMFSCFNMKPAAATILAISYLFVNIVLDLIPYFDQYQNWFITHHFNCWLLVFQNPIPWAQIVQSEIVLAAMGATAFVIGAVAFQVRDFKS